MAIITLIFFLYFITGLIRVLNNPYKSFLYTLKIFFLIDLLIELFQTIKDYLDID